MEKQAFSEHIDPCGPKRRLSDCRICGVILNSSSIGRYGNFKRANERAVVRAKTDAYVNTVTKIALMRSRYLRYLPADDDDGDDDVFGFALPVMYSRIWHCNRQRASEVDLYRVD